MDKVEGEKGADGDHAAALPLGGHLPGTGPGGVKGAPKGRVETAFHLFDRQFEKRRPLAWVVGVANDNVEVAKSCDGFRHHLVYRRSIGDVRLYDQDLPAIARTSSATDSAPLASWK